ncbi:MAG: rRNA maturation RNase YbeY [candidate division WOR-3 bacterium]
MKIRVLNTSDQRVKSDAARLARTLNQFLLNYLPRFDLRRSALSQEPPAICVNVVLVDDHRIRELNRRFRKQDRPTDVLSFPLGAADLDTGEVVLGEIYVSRDRARAQARENGVAYHNELKRLMLHGILHLLGFTHREMEPFYRNCL